MTRSILVLAAATALLISAACGTDATRPPANANRLSNANAAKTDGPPLTREEFEKKKDGFVKDARDRGRKVGAGPDDLWLWAKTRDVLSRDPDLRDIPIDVDVENGVVTLNGSVGTIMQKLRAESGTRDITGVKGVTNLLKVGPKAAATNVNA